MPQLIPLLTLMLIMSTLYEESLPWPPMRLPQQKHHDGSKAPHIKITVRITQQTLNHVWFAISNSNFKATSYLQVRHPSYNAHLTSYSSKTTMTMNPKWAWTWRSFSQKISQNTSFSEKWNWNSRCWQTTKHVEEDNQQQTLGICFPFLVYDDAIFIQISWVMRWSWDFHP